MYRIVVLLVLCLHALSQPVTNEASTRPARQLTECCPCPNSTNGDQEVLVGHGQLARAGAPDDDCPFRPRGADSEGASSFLFPSTVLKDGPLVRQNDRKDDPKNLLEPEVALATSVLDTLQKATEEEYQDALARDAAKSAAESDSLPEETARNVVIIEKFRDSDDNEDLISEASHDQESRCVHPLRPTSLGQMRKLSNSNNILQDTLEFSKVIPPGFKNMHIGNDLGATNIQESTIIDGNENTRKFQSQIPKFELSDPLKNILDDNTHSFRQPTSNFSKLDKKESSIPEGLFPLVSKLKSHKNMFPNNDLTTSPNNLQEQSEVADGKNRQLLRNSIAEVNSIDEAFFGDSDSKITNENLNDLDTILSLSRIQPLVSADNKNERMIDATSQNENKNDQDYNFMESSELANSIKNQIQENQDESKILSDSDKPQIITVSREENKNENDAQDVTVDKSLQNQVSNTNKNLEIENSNIAPTLVHLESREKHITDLLPQNQENTKGDVESFGDHEFDSDYSADDEIKRVSQAKSLENIEKIPQFKKIPPLSRTLSNLQENVVRKYKNFKKPSINSELSRISQERDNLNDNRNDMTVKLQPAGTDKFINKQTTDDISFNDLQSMSDKLLDPNLMQQSDSFSLKAAECDIKSNEDNFESNELGSKTDNKLFESNLNPINAKNKFIKSDKHTKENSETIDDKRKTPENQVQSLRLANKNTDLKEMDVGASDNTIIKTLPSTLDPFNFNSKLRSPLIENIGVRAPQDSLSFIRKPLGEVNLPTIEDLRARVTNIFNTNDRSAEDDLSSLENDYTNNYPYKTMAFESSTTNSRIKLPPIKQLKDFDVEIFRNRPKMSSHIEKLTPKFNLKPFKAKIPVPSKLEHKPVKMESRLGHARKVKPNNSEVRLESLPSLDDLRNNLRFHPKNLLSSSSRPDLNLFTDNFKSYDIGDIAEIFRLNTQNTVKTLRQRMKSTLRKTKTYNKIGDPFAKPQELLEDVNDKLKGIHYDLNDRLSSIHENIMDSPQIKTLVNQPRKLLTDRNDFPHIMSNFQQNKVNPPSSSPQKASSTVATQKLSQYNSKHKDFIPNKGSKRFMNLGRDKSNNIQTAAESAPTSIIDMPKSSTLPYLQKPTPFRQNPSMSQFLKERIPFSALREPTNFEYIRPVLRSSLNPFKNQPKKVTISFETTTARQITSPRPMFTPRVPTMTSPQFDEHRQNIISRANDKSAPQRDWVDHTSKPAEETEISPIKFKPLRNSAPAPSSHNEKIENYIKDKISLEKYPLKNLNLRAPESNKMTYFKTQGNSNRFMSANIFDNSQETIPASRSLVKPTVWPKVNESSLLSKVRDSVNMKLSHRDRNSDTDIKTEHKPDMLKSPSENTAIVLDEPLKENVSYKCSMVCTKEIR